MTGVMGDVTEIGNAFGSLFGNEGIKGFFTHLMKATPGIGVFLIIYTLMMFVSKITIFKSEDHHKYAHMFGIGVALIAITNNTLYTFLVDFLAGTFLELVLILVVVFAIIILINYLKKYHYEAQEGSIKAATKASISSGEYAKTNNESRAIRRLMRRERRSRRATSNSVNKLNRASKDADGLIKEMENQLAHAASLQSKGESTRAIRQGILDRMSSFVSDIKKENNSANELQKEIKNLQKLDLREYGFDKLIKGDYDSFIKHIRTDKAGVSSRISNKHRDLITEHADNIVKIHGEKEKLIKDMTNIIFEVSSEDSKIDSLKDRLTSALERGKIGECSAALSAIKSHLNEVSSDDRKLDLELNKVRHLIQTIQDLKRDEEKLIKELNPNIKPTKRTYTSVSDGKKYYMGHRI